MNNGRQYFRMKKAFAVARWEYLEKIKSKAFLISLFLMPIIMIVMGVLPSLLASKADSEPRVIGVIDETDQIYQHLADRVVELYKLPNGQPNYILRRIDIATDTEAAKELADEMVLNDEIEGFFVLSKELLDHSDVEYRSMNVGNIRITERFTRIIQDIVFEKRLFAAGIDPVLVRKSSPSIELKTVKVTEAGGQEARFEQVFLSAYVFMMMMFFLVITSGQLLVRSIMEEKMNRVVEILVSSCSANELMTGKVLGLSGLGLTQLAFWGLIGLTISLKLGVTLIDMPNFLLLIVFFVLGYLLYAAIFVAAGSPISTEQEAQHITSYLVLILVLPVALAFPVLLNPNSLLVKVLTFIPLITPTMMAIRIPVQMPPVEEIVIAIVLLAVSAAAAMWAAGKIFRTAILAYGKRPSIGELLKLLRTAT
jgi:ABC-2 type transport system permease protein